jgi:hypothetical protein
MRIKSCSTDTISEGREDLQRIYETISDKPEKMIKYENAPRPY